MMRNISSTLGPQLQRRLVLLVLSWLMIGCSNDIQEREPIQAHYVAPQRSYSPSSAPSKIREHLNKVSLALTPSFQPTENPNAYEDTALLESVSAASHHKNMASHDNVIKHSQVDKDNRLSPPEQHHGKHGQAATIPNDDNKLEKDRQIKPTPEHVVNDASNARKPTTLQEARHKLEKQAEPSSPLGTAAASDNGLFASITRRGAETYRKLREKVYGKTVPDQTHSNPTTTYQPEVIASITKRGTEAYEKLKEKVYGKTVLDQTHSNPTIVDPTQRLHQRLTGQLERRAESVSKAEKALRKASSNVYTQDTAAREAQNQEIEAIEKLLDGLRPIIFQNENALADLRKQLTKARGNYEDACLKKYTALQGARSTMIAARTQVKQLRWSAAELARQEQVAKKKGLTTSQGNIWAQVAHSQAIATKTASIIARNACIQCQLLNEQLDIFTKKIEREKPTGPTREAEKVYNKYLKDIEEPLGRIFDALQKEVAKAKHAAKLAQEVAVDAKKALEKAKKDKEAVNKIGQVIVEVEATKEQVTLAKEAAKEARQYLLGAAKYNEILQCLPYIER